MLATRIVSEDSSQLDFVLGKYSIRFRRIEEFDSEPIISTNGGWCQRAALGQVVDVGPDVVFYQ